MITLNYRRFATFCIIITLSSAFAAAQYWPPRFAVTRNDAIWMSNALLVNKFDSAAAECEIGEFELYRSGAPAHRMVYMPDSGIGRSYAGMSPPGLDTSLARVLRTSVFRYLPGDSLRFFRKLAVANYCAEDPTSQEQSQNERSAIDAESRLAYFSLLRQGMILDDTRFVLRIVDSATNTTLYTLDSVGIPPNPNSKLSPPFGTSPLTCNRIVALPQAFANTAVYLRVDPYRFGPTPVGLGLSFAGRRYTASSIASYDTSFYIPMRGDSLHTARENGYIDALMDHYDSVLAADGCVAEEETAIYFRNDSVAYAFLTRYYDNVDVSARPMRYTIRPCASAKQRDQSLLQISHGAGIRLYQRAGGDPVITIDVRNAKSLPGLTVRGYEVATGRMIFSSSACPGSTACTLQTPPLAQGAYVFTLQDVGGLLLTARTMIR